MSGLCYMPATEALRLFRERALSPVELLRALIDRAEAVETHVNAFGDTTSTRRSGRRAKPRAATRA